MTLLALTAALFLTPAVPSQSGPPTFVHSRIDQTLGGWHATTRTTVRLVHVHEGRWLVFRGNPNAYHFSPDGLTWTMTEAEQASRSHFIDGDTIHTQYSIDIDPAPDTWDFKHYVALGEIAGESITWQPGVEVPMRLSYYPDIERDASGRSTMTGRAVMRDADSEMTGEEMLWIRSEPGNFLTWGPELRCFQHVGDTGDWKEIGSVAHENVMLEGDQSYLLAMMTSGGNGLLLGRLHTGQEFVGDDVLVAGNMSTWRGTDKRMSACYDPAARMIHLVYVDDDGRLWYRNCPAPFAEDDWSEPERIGAENCFTTMLALDRSTTPATPWVLYGETRYMKVSDERQAWGDLYLIGRDATGWRGPVLVSEPDEHENWYPNMNEDVSRGFGIMYLKGGQEGPEQDGKRVLDIIFASTGAPQ